MNIKIASDATERFFDVFLRLNRLTGFLRQMGMPARLSFRKQRAFFRREGTIFDYNPVISNRQMSVYASLTSADNGGDCGVMTYMLLKDFPANVGIGSRSEGGVLHYGKEGAEVLGARKFYGYVNSQVK